MTPENFCYWLDGWIQLSGENDVNGDYTDIDRHQLKIIREKLESVLAKRESYNK